MEENRRKIGCLVLWIAEAAVGDDDIFYGVGTGGEEGVVEF